VLIHDLIPRERIAYNRITRYYYLITLNIHYRVQRCFHQRIFTQFLVYGNIYNYISEQNNTEHILSSKTIRVV
jgi:hypothetical protein